MPGANLTINELALLPDSEQQAILSQFSDEEIVQLAYDWRFLARPNQLPPDGDWRIWLILAGRGFGKTRAICEWARLMANAMPGSRGAFVAATAADARDVLVEGESGILAISPPFDKPHYSPTKRLVSWGNGSQASMFSADEPDRLRGPQFHWAIVDELGAWRYPIAYDMLQFGLRLGTNPQMVIATTPKPVKHLRALVEEAKTPTAKIVITSGSTYENAANLAPSFLDKMRSKYEGTRLGQQELYAVLHDDAAHSLWKSWMFEHEAFRVEKHRLPEMKRIVVAIDPAVKAGDSTKEGDMPDDNAAETGIILAGLGTNGHGYILEDGTVAGSPDLWARVAVGLYRENLADLIVGEINNGGNMVGHTVKTVDDSVNFREVIASRAKQTRAEPIVALYEQRRVHHVGVFAELETQMTQWEPGAKSPDRLDAAVWALTELMVDPEEEEFVFRQGYYR